MRRVIEARILTAVERRVAAALTALPRPAQVLRVQGRPFGLVDEARRARLVAFRGVFTPTDDGLALDARLDAPDVRTAALAEVAHALAQDGALTAWRDERYAVTTSDDPAAVAAPAAFLLERAAARYFGIRTYAAHANGLVGSGSSPRMWLARRSPMKPIDPGQLDNLVGGGIAAGETPRATLLREAWEEAGIPRALAEAARDTGFVTVERAVPDGFQRETIFTFDLALPPSFEPVNQDAEVAEHRLFELAAVAQLLASTEGPDVATLDATCVALACLRRHLSARQ
jgi:8-oxo-dGTP pyrophosphatase MutT (NUDIX family)